MSLEYFQTLLALALGFAVAGLLSTGYQVITAQPASFRLLSRTSRAMALAAVPFIVFAAPFIIMRNMLRRRGETDRKFEAAMAATVVAGFWSLMSGTVMMMGLQALESLLV